jgi:PAS domain S-box-containing protein
MLPRQGRRNTFIPYAIAIVSTAGAFALRWALQPWLGDRQPFVLFFAAIALTSWLGHWRAAAGTLIAALLLSDYFFIPPAGTLGLKDPQTLFSLFLLGSVAVLVIVCMERAKGALRAQEATQAELRATFDNPSVGHGQGDPNTGMMVQVNDALCRMLGYTRDEFLHMKIADFVHPDDRHLTREGVRQLLDGTLTHYEHDKRFLHKDGSTLWLRVTASLLRDQQGRPERVLGVFENIHTRKAAEQSVAKHELQLGLVLEAARFGACEWNLADNSLVWSKEHFELLGYESNSFQPTVEHFLKPVHPEDLAGLNEALELGKQSRATVTHEFRIVLPRTNETRWMQAIARYNCDEHGRAVSLNGLLMDVTERRQAAEVMARQQHASLEQEAKHFERLVAERTDQLHVSLMDMENLCYTIAHDLRAPLRAMQGFARALEEDYSAQLDAPGREYAQRITRAAARMDALITDLLAYGRIGTGEMNMHPVELDTIIDQFLADYAETIRDRNATVCVERLLPVVIANPGVLQQVVANLLLNAVKFVGTGVTPQVRVYAEDRGEFARLCVEDNGIGIAEEHRAKLFHVFQRLHTPDKYPGTGIGLAMVKKAIERMKGRAGFDSKPECGSTFWIELQKPSDSALAGRRTARNRTSI